MRASRAAASQGKKAGTWRQRALGVEHKGDDDAD
jgi:hypothetical protein